MNRLGMLTAASTAFAAIGLVPPAARAAVSMNVGVGPDEDFAEGYYAADANFFQQAGIQASLTEMASGAALSAAAVSGALDVATTNMGSIITAYGHSVPLQIVAPGAIYSNTELTAALIVAKDSPIHSAADLRGKTVAVSTLNTLYHTSVRNWIDKNGGTSADVRYVELPLSSHLPSLIAGRIDAAASVEPWLSQAKSQTRVLGDPYASVANRFLISCWVASTSWCAANRSTLESFRTVMRKTAAWANQNPRQTGAILQKYYKIDPAIVEAIPRTEMGVNLDPKLVQPVIDMMVRYTLVPAEFDAGNLFARG